MKLRAYLGLAAGMFMLAGAAAYALTGFLPFQVAFEAARVPVGVITGSYIAWIWGSFAMAGLGLITLVEASRALRERPYSRPVVAFSGLTFLVFGAWALGISGFNPHFLYFVVLGVMTIPLAFRFGMA
jgi:hypothetical protein